MDFVTLIFIALALSMDAFAVSVTNGMCNEKITKRHVFYTAFTFGFFQALMPILGYTLGQTFAEIVIRYQHWIALLLLGAIGCNMLADGWKERKTSKEVCTSRNIFTVKNLIMQGIATSIDAFAAGVSIAVMNINIVSAAILIGAITFICCILGVWIGKKFGSLLGIRAKFIGGIVLLSIGFKIFIQGQFF